MPIRMPDGLLFEERVYVRLDPEMPYTGGDELPFQVAVGQRMTLHGPALALFDGDLIVCDGQPRDTATHVLARLQRTGPKEYSGTVTRGGTFATVGLAEERPDA